MTETFVILTPGRQVHGDLAVFLVEEEYSIELSGVKEVMEQIWEALVMPTLDVPVQHNQHLINPVIIKLVVPLKHVVL